MIDRASKVRILLVMREPLKRLKVQASAARSIRGFEGQFKACGEDRACEAIPVELRRPRTFWATQSIPSVCRCRSHQALIDFILPY
jgi:hypothetical protein